MKKNQPNRMIASKNALAKTINAPLDADSVNGIADLVIEDNANKSASIRGADASIDVSCTKNINVNEIEKKISAKNIFFEEEEEVMTTFPEVNPKVPEGAMLDARNFLKLLVKDTSATVLSRDLMTVLVAMIDVTCNSDDGDGVVDMLEKVIELMKKGEDPLWTGKIHVETTRGYLNESKKRPTENKRN